MQITIYKEEDFDNPSLKIGSKMITKQIDNICDILMVYIGTEMFSNKLKIKDMNHKAVEYYFSKEGISFLTYYCSCLCKRYKDANKKEYVKVFTLYGLIAWFDMWYDGDFPILCKNNLEFIGKDFVE